MTAFVQELRGADLHKLAGVSETLDWVAALVALEKDQLDESTVEHTLGILLKDHDDIESLRGERLAALVKDARARAVALPPLDSGQTMDDGRSTMDDGRSPMDDRR